MTDERNEKETLQAYLKELHLPTFRASFEEVARRAQQEGLSYERFLLELAQREVQERRNGRIARLLRQSQLRMARSSVVSPQPGMV
jgi:IstB-like ATP binding protein